MLSAPDRRGLPPWCGALLPVLLPILLPVLLLAPGRTLGQRIAPDEALAGLVIHAAAPTPQGWVWLATERGAFRYDGYRLVPLRALTTAGPQPDGQPFTTVLLDSAGTLWVGGPGGLFAFTPATGRLRAVPLPVGRATRAGITALGQHDGALWVGANTDPLTVIRLDLRHPGRAPYVVLRHPTGYISDFIPDSTGALLALGFRRSWRIGPAGTVALLATRARFHGSLRLPDGRRQWVPEGRHLPVPGQGGHWRVGADALYQVGPTGREQVVERWPLTAFVSPRTLQIVELDSTWYWSAASQVLSLSLRRGSGLRPPVRRAQTPLDFGRELVLVPVGGGAALLGFRRDGSGAVRIGPDRRTAERLAVAPATALSTRAIGRLPDGRLFVSSYQGVFTQAADSPAAPLRRWRTAEQAGVWFADLPLPGGRHLLANELGHFDILGPDGHQTRLPWAPPHPRLIETNGLCLLRDAAGRYWGGTVAGLFEIDLARRQVRRYREADRTFVLHRRRIEGLAEGPAGVLWVATAEGLYRLTVATGALVRYGPDEPPPRRLPTANIRCLLVPHPDSVWLGTFDAGLLLLRPGQGVMRRLGPEQGLPSASVAALRLSPPPARTLWISTYHGLVSYHLRTHGLRVLTTADGLATDELNRQSLWYDAATAHLYAGGVGGVSRVEVRPPVDTAYRPPLLLAALRQHHAAQDITTTRYPAVGAAVPLTLDPGDGFLDLSLALPDFAPGGAGRFAYRLRPDEQARGARWLWLTGTAPLRLQNLAPGGYTLDIQARTAAGTPARNRLRLPLTVRLPWQRRPAVWALAASLLAALVGSGVYIWQRAAAARRAAETRLRARLAADLHDEVGALLTRVTLFAELAQADPEPALLEELLTESRSAAATVRDIIWSVDTAADTAEALADRLRDLLDQAARASGRNTRFSLTPPAFDLTRRLRPDVRQHTYLIGREAVTNALKHGPAGGALHLTLTLDATALVLEVRDEDAATAMPMAPVGRGGQGLRNMLARARQIGGTLEACGPLPEGGWVVRLRVPAPLA